MASYRVNYREEAIDDLEKIDSRYCDLILRKIDRLASIPRSQQTKKLKGRDDTYRLRVGDYRVVYVIDDENACINISHIKHRKDVYR